MKGKIETAQRSALSANFSIFELLLRCMGRGAAVVILLTMIAEGVLLYVMMQGETMYYENLFARGATKPLYIGFVALTCIFLYSKKSEKTNLDYTLKRLAVKPASIFIDETLFVAGMYLIFWGFAVAVLCGFGFYFNANISEAYNKEVGVLLAFARTHDLFFWLPVGSASLALRQAVGILALSASIARTNYFKRKGESKLVGLIITSYLFLRAFFENLTNATSNLAMAAMLLVMLIFSVGTTIFEEAEQ